MILFFFHPTIAGESTNQYFTQLHDIVLAFPYIPVFHFFLCVFCLSSSKTDRHTSALGYEQPAPPKHISPFDPFHQYLPLCEFCGVLQDKSIPFELVYLTQSRCPPELAWGTDI